MAPATSNAVGDGQDVVFVKSLQDVVERVPEYANDKDIERYQKDLLEIFGRDEESAVMGVSLFTKAARETEYSEFTRRLMRKGADIARARIATTDRKIAASLRAESNSNPKLRRIEAALLRMAVDTQFQKEDVHLLFDTYLYLLDGDAKENSNGNNTESNALAPSYSPDDMRALVDMLCFGDILIAFISSAFKNPMDESRRTCLCMLISTAEEFMSRPTSSNHLDQKGVRDDCRARIAAQYEWLNMATKVCLQLPPDCGMAQFGKEKRAEQLVNAIETGGGSVGFGILEWVQAGIAGSTGYTLGKSLVKYLAFVEAVAYHNEKLREKCVNVVHFAFMNTTEDAFKKVNIDIRDLCRDKCVESYAALAGLHCAEHIMKTMEESYLENSTIDNSHIRKMVRGIVDSLAPPYSVEFLDCTRRFLKLHRVAQSLGACEESKRIVRKFMMDNEGGARRPRAFNYEARIREFW